MKRQDFREIKAAYFRMPSGRLVKIAMGKDEGYKSDRWAIIRCWWRDTDIGEPLWVCDWMSFRFRESLAERCFKQDCEWFVINTGSDVLDGDPTKKESEE